MLFNFTTVLLNPDVKFLDESSRQREKKRLHKIGTKIVLKHKNISINNLFDQLALKLSRSKYV